MTTKRYVRKSEALAIMSEAIHTDGKAQWWDQLAAIPANERVGTTEVVSIRGSLEHHRGLGSDCYESILERVQAALEGEENGVPDCVVLRIDSPGGVVSGLNETVYAIRRLSKESGVTFIAYVDELAASAAYALACSCDEIVMPASAICGSVGVISTLYDQVKADEAMGINFATLTSGERKADGHPHVALSKEALDEEQKKVDRLAKQFFRLVAEVRPLDLMAIEKLQAGIFLGKEALSNGLADAIMGFDEFISIVNVAGTVAKKPLANSSQNGSVSDSQSTLVEKRSMSQVVLKNLVRRTEAAIASEKDSKKRKALSVTLASYQAALEAYKKEKHTVETHQVEEGPEEDEEEADCETAGEAASEDEPSDDDTDDDEEPEEEAAATKKSTSALAALAHQVTGKKGRAAVGALAAMVAQGQRAAAEVDAMRKEQRIAKKATAIEAAMNARRITRHEAETLKGKPLSFVESFLEMRPKAIINVDDDSVRIPGPGAKSGGSSGLTPELNSQIEFAIAAAPDGVNKADLRKSMVEAHEQRMLAAVNGGGRY